MRRGILVSLVVVVAALIAAPGASAAVTQCNGVLVGTFDNVVVPPGATCNLSDSTVRQNVAALQDSRLFMHNDTVGDNVAGALASSVQFDVGSVGGDIFISGAHDPVFASAVLQDLTLPNGSVRIEKGRPPNGVVLATGLDIQTGDLNVTDNSSIFATDVRANTVGGDMNVLRNTGTGEKSVGSNSVGDRLLCRDNTQPFIGGPNQANDIDGQCFGVEDGLATSQSLGASVPGTDEFPIRNEP